MTRDEREQFVALITECFRAAGLLGVPVTPQWLADRLLKAGVRLSSPAPRPGPLTVCQRVIWEFVAGTIRQKGYAPTLEEIAAEMGYRSLATVQEHLGNLERKGWIRRIRNEARAITLRVPAPAGGAA